jgi:hypothetical protein
MTMIERIGQERVRALLPPLGAALAVGAATLYVGAVDPNEAGHYPTCPFLALTGLYCPGCGGLRTVHALVHGDVHAALGLNALVVVMAPVAVLLWVRWLVLAWQGKPARIRLPHPAYGWALLGLVIVFSVVRNLPFGAFLAP